jgi:hypothetical protein
MVVRTLKKLLSNHALIQLAPLDGGGLSGCPSRRRIRIVRPPADPSRIDGGMPNPFKD